MKNNQISQYQCKTYERDGQLAFALNTEIILPETAEVRYIDAELLVAPLINTELL